MASPTFMARPRVFVSSTYYDLKHIRSSLDIFIESLGFDPILSEKGSIAFSPDIALDESCYREVENADIFVLVIGGRYGSEISGAGASKGVRTFFDRYESITKKEYESAVRKDLPIYILVEANVHAEYQTYLKNKGNDGVNFAHVDSANIFVMIEEILSKPRNNPTKTFERYADIEEWLRDQWSGLFRELLSRRSQQQQLTTLSLQVAELREINQTLRKYLEAVMSGISPDDSTSLIQSEHKRLAEAEIRERLQTNDWCKFVARRNGLTLDESADLIRRSASLEAYADLVDKNDKTGDLGLSRERIIDIFTDSEAARRDFNAAREVMGLKPLRFKKKRTDVSELEDL